MCIRECVSAENRAFLCKQNAKNASSKLLMCLMTQDVDLKNSIHGHLL